MLGELSTLVRTCCCGVQRRRGQPCSPAAMTAPRWTGWAGRFPHPADLLGHYAAKGHGGPLLQLQPPHGCGALPPAAVHESLSGDLTALEAQGPAAGKQCPTGQLLRAAAAESGGTVKLSSRPRTARHLRGGCPTSGKNRRPREERPPLPEPPLPEEARSAGVRRTGGAAAAPPLLRHPLWGAVGGGRWQRAARAACRLCTGCFWICAQVFWRAAC